MQEKTLKCLLFHVFFIPLRRVNYNVLHKEDNYK